MIQWTFGKLDPRGDEAGLLQRAGREAAVPMSRALEVRDPDAGDAGVEGWTPPPHFTLLV